MLGPERMNSRSGMHDNFRGLLPLYPAGLVFEFVEP